LNDASPSPPNNPTKPTAQSVLRDVGEMYARRVQRLATRLANWAADPRLPTPLRKDLRRGSLELCSMLATLQHFQLAEAAVVSALNERPEEQGEQPAFDFHAPQLGAE